MFLLQMYVGLHKTDVLIFPLELTKKTYFFFLTLWH